MRPSSPKRVPWTRTDFFSVLAVTAAFFQQLEEKVAQLSKKKTELETGLASPEIYNDKNKFVQTETAYKNTTAELDKLNTEYEVVFEKVMELEEKMG